MNSSTVATIDFKTYIGRILDRMEAEKIAFERVIRVWSITSSSEPLGNLSFAIACSAMAAFDAVAAVFSKNPQNGPRIKALLTSGGCFDEEIYGSADVFYNLIRCGLMHQAHPVGMGMNSDVNDSRPLTWRGNQVNLNAHALYVDVLRGLNKLLVNAENNGALMTKLNANCVRFQNLENAKFRSGRLEAGIRKIPQIVNFPEATQPPIARP